MFTTRVRLSVVEKGIDYCKLNLRKLKLGKVLTDFFGRQVNKSIFEKEIFIMF